MNHSVCNHTKWEELRLAMLGIPENRPRWRTKTLNGHTCEWDGEWYYHFSIGGHKDIEWCEIKLSNKISINHILKAISHIGLCGIIINEKLIRIYGYVDNSGEIAILKCAQQGDAPEPVSDFNH
jgi:hypothetical protein